MGKQDNIYRATIYALLSVLITLILMTLFASRGERRALEDRIRAVENAEIQREDSSYRKPWSGR